MVFPAFLTSHPSTNVNLEASAAAFEQELAKDKTLPPQEIKPSFLNDDGSIKGSAIDLKGRSVADYLRELEAKDPKHPGKEFQKLSALDRADLVRRVLSAGDLRNNRVEQIKWLMALYKDFKLNYAQEQNMERKIGSFWQSMWFYYNSYKGDWENQKPNDADKERENLKKQEILRQLYVKHAKAFSYAPLSNVVYSSSCASDETRRGNYNPSTRKLTVFGPKVVNFYEAYITDFHESTHCSDFAEVEKFKALEKINPKDDDYKLAMMLYVENLEGGYITDTENVEGYKLNPSEQKAILAASILKDFMSGKLPALHDNGQSRFENSSLATVPHH